MAALNAKFRKKEGPTDVLSFPAPGPVRRLGMLGELVICLPVLVRQAREQGHPPERELRVLLVHGVLHLLGLDHERGPEEAALQRHWETVLLRRLDSGSSAASRSALGLIARAEPAAKGRGRRASPRRKPRGRRA
jgi:probable rRNA maturation factor